MGVNVGNVDPRRSAGAGRPLDVVVLYGASLLLTVPLQIYRR